MPESVMTLSRCRLVSPCCPGEAGMMVSGFGMCTGHACLSGLTFGIESVYFIYTVTFFLNI
jgi:hypothetical protein